tara:strand:- start:6500 stop:6694 length:195 start_codon:yes stop_codon:yes gene_type:complete
MSKTTEIMFKDNMQLTPKHVDAMHLIKLFVKEYEHADWMGSDRAKIMLANRMSNLYDTCKNFGF